MMRSLLTVELRKASASPGTLLIVVCPGLVGLLVLLAVARSEEPGAWGLLFESFALPVWALFMLPMSMTAVTALFGQIEHESRGFDHLMALPVPRWQVFATKMMVVYAAVFVISGALVVFVYAGGFVGGLVGTPPAEGLAFASTLSKAARIAAGALLLSGIQAWVALRFRSFVAAVATGTAGTLVVIAVAMTGVQGAEWFPWTYPFRALTGVGGPDPVVWSVAGAMVVTVCAVLDLCRREHP